jgi:glutamyl-tRNA synthetase
MLYEALGFPVPEFAHLPLILAKEGGRMSKRKGATAISEYRQQGYLAPALVNFLLLLGWSPGENQEIIDINDAAKKFDITGVNKTAAVMDIDKLDWINNQYLKTQDPEKLADEIIPVLAEKNLIAKNNFDRKYIVSLVKLFQARLTVLADFPEWADFFFLEEPNMDPKAAEKHLSQDLSRQFALFAERLEKIEPFDIANIETCFRSLVAELGMESKALIHPVRVALTGKTIGPGLFEVIYYLGKERTRKRLLKQVEKGG